MSETAMARYSAVALRSNDLTEADRGPLIELFRGVRQTSMKLQEPLSPEDQMLQSMADASPTRWHLAHITWFFETFILKRFVADYRPFHDQFETLFNSYYNSVGEQWPRPQRGLLSRPSVAEILDYRAHVDRHAQAFFENCPGDVWAQVVPILQIGINHEQQHQELLFTDLKHAMALNPLHPEVYPAPKREDRQAPNLEWRFFKGGLREIGFEGSGFAFDCEGPRHTVYMRDFKLANRPVTNGEFIDFIEDGGYGHHMLWLSDGWATVKAQGWEAPLYWKNLDGQWHRYTLHGLEPVDRQAPVSHVSLYEADAYASWIGKRLPTEQEWEVASAGETVGGNFFDWTTDVVSPDPAPAPAAPRDGKLHQMFGDVWEWTQTAYTPYPGFEAAPGAIGEYNGKFMSSQMVLRGGSCATPVGHIRPTYRNFFPPDARWQFSGLRLADDT